MATEYPAFKAAAAHVAPVFLDAEKTVAKACSLIAEAARQGAALIAFPETYIPAFPLWSAVVAPISSSVEAKTPPGRTGISKSTWPIRTAPISKRRTC